MEALGNFLAVREANPELRILFRFFTNAQAGKEAGIAFPGGAGGINAWEQVRRGQNPRAVNDLAEGLRALFCTRDWQERSPGARVAAFLQQPVETIEQELIKPFEWAVGSPSQEQLQPAGEGEVLRLGLARSREEAEEVYARLLIHALRTIASSDHKRLDRAGLLEIATHDSLGGEDKSLLRELRALSLKTAEQLAVLGEEVSALHSQQNDTRQRIAAIQDQFTVFGQDLIPGFKATKTTSRPRMDEPPFPPAIYAPREILVAHIQHQVEQETWVGLRSTAWMGKTQVARAVLNQHPGPRWWVAFRAEPERLASHLVDQLLLWYEVLTGADGLADRYSNGRIEAHGVIKAVASALGQTALLVLDDFPSDAPPELRMICGLVGSVFREAGHRVLSTSQVHMPREVIDALGTSFAGETVPPLDFDDISTLLQTAGAPHRMTHELSVLVQELSGGHPVFVASMARALAAAGWNVQEEQVRQLLEGEPLRADRRTARAAVTSLTPDAEARDLLDRVSILRTSFGYPMVSALAGVRPTIARPHERLNAVLGRWVEELPAAKYAVTPLLQGLGDEILPAETRRGLHSAVADVYLTQQSIDAEDAFEAARHLAGSGSTLRLAGFIASIGLGVRTPREARNVEWLPLHFLPGEGWPADVPASIRIVVRAVQTRILLLRDRPASEYEADLEDLVAAAQPDELHAVAFARYATALPDAVPAAETARRAIQAARAIRAMAYDPFPSPEVPPEQLFWAAGLRMRGAEDLAALVPVIASLTAEERRLVFAAEPGFDGAILLLELAYLGAKAQGAGTDWEAVQRTLAELERLGQLEGAEPLRAASLRVQALLLADVHGRPGDAIELLRTQEVGSPADETHFIINATRAAILLLHSPPTEAYEAFASALEMPGASSSPFLRAESWRRGAESAASSGNLNQARAWSWLALRYERTLQNRQGNDPYVEVELLAELALILWHRGPPERSCRSLASAVGHLVASADPASKRFRETFGRVRYLLSWLLPLATTGKPPAPPPGVTTLRAPFFGFTRRWSPDLSTFPEDQFLPARLYVDVARIAFAVGRAGLARSAFLAGSRALMATGDEQLARIMDWERAFVEVHLGNVEGGIDAALDGRLGFALGRVQDSTEAHAAWDALDQSTQDSLERLTVLHSVLIGTFMNLAARGAQRDEAIAQLDRLARAISKNQAQLRLHSRWVHLLDRIRWILTERPNRAQILALFPGGEDEGLVLTAALAEAQDALPGEVLSAQISILAPLATELGVSGAPLLLDTSRWIRRTWSRLSAEKGFLFRSPSLLRHAVGQLQPEPRPTSDAARILVAAAGALGADLGAEIRSTLVTMSGGDPA